MFRKFMMILLCLALVLSLCGCGENPAATAPAESSSLEGSATSAEPTAEETEPITDTTEEVSTEAPVLEEPTTFSLCELTPAATYNDVYSLFLDAEASAYADAGITELFPEAAADFANDTAVRYGEADLSALTCGFATGDSAVLFNGKVAFLSGKELVIVSASGAGSEELSRTDVTTELSGSRSGTDTPVALFAYENSVFAVTYEVSETAVSSSAGLRSVSVERTHLKQYRVADDGSASIVLDFAQDGRYEGAYLSEGRLYLLSSYGVSRMESEDSGTYIPSVMVNGEDAQLEPGRILLSPNTQSTDYTLLSCCAIADCNVESTLALTGYYAWSLCDGDTLYLARTATTTQSTEAYPEAQYSVTAHSTGSCTYLVQVDGLQGEVSGACCLEGCVTDRSSLALLDGTLYAGLVSDRAAYCVYTDEVYGFVNYLKTDETSGASVYAVAADLGTLSSSVRTPEEYSVYRLYLAGGEALLLGYESLCPEYTLTLGTDEFEAIGENLVLPSLCAAPVDGSFLAFCTDEEAATLRLYAIDNGQLTQKDAVSVGSFDGDILFSDTGRYAAVPSEDGYRVYLAEDGKLTEAGTLEVGYHVAGTKLLDNGFNLYFCDDSRCVVASDDMKVLAEIDFALG